MGPRVRIEDAEALLSDLRAARVLAEEQQKWLESSIAVVRIGLDRAVADMVRADPSVKRLCGKYTETQKQFVDLRRALDFLRLKGVLPQEFLFSESEWRDMPGDRPWRDAFAKLEYDADTLLPEI